MILGPDELFDELRAIVRREQPTAVLHREAIVHAIAEAQAEAAELAAGVRSGEIAAVFYSFGTRGASFRPVARFFTDMVVRAQAAASGFELEMTEVELKVLLAGLARRQLDFPALHGWVVARLRPLGDKPKRLPPMRPR